MNEVNKIYLWLYVILSEKHQRKHQKQNSAANRGVKDFYSKATPFSNGYAAVCIDKEWHYIDSEGNIVLSGDFEDDNGMTADGTTFVFVNNEWKLLQLYSYGH